MDPVICCSAYLVSRFKVLFHKVQLLSISALHVCMCVARALVFGNKDNIVEGVCGYLYFYTPSIYVHGTMHTEYS